MLMVGNGRMITRDPSCPYDEDGAVVLEGPLIKAAGPAKVMKERYPGATFIDAHGGVIMPAFINTHEHMYSTMARGISIPGYHPAHFTDILESLWWNIDAHLTLAQIRQSARAACLDCIKNGVTTVFDHHASYGAIEGSLLIIEEAMRETGIRGCLCFEVSDRAGKDKAREAVRENMAFIRHASSGLDGRIAGMLGLHASMTLSDETLSFCLSEMPAGAGCHVHVAESADDVDHCRKTYGQRIVERLSDRGVLGKKTLAVHCVHINRHEMGLLKDTGTMVVHNPESNMGNACGCPPVLDMVHIGILTGLGTDGYTHDMLESFKVAGLLQRHHLRDANAAWTEIPDMLFKGNAAIASLFFQAPLGVLKEGAAADVIVLDNFPPTPMNASNYDSHILFGMSGRSVMTTISGGRILMKDRALTDLDEEKIMADTRAEAAKLWKSMNI